MASLLALLRGPKIGMAGAEGTVEELNFYVARALVDARSPAFRREYGGHRQLQLMPPSFQAKSKGATQIFIYWLYREKLPSTFDDGDDDGGGRAFAPLNDWFEAWALFRRHEMIEAQNAVMRRLCRIADERRREWFFDEDDLATTLDLKESRNAKLRYFILEFVHLSLVAMPGYSFTNRFPRFAQDAEFMRMLLDVQVQSSRAAGDMCTAIDAVIQDRKDDWVKDGGIWLLEDEEGSE